MLVSERRGGGQGGDGYSGDPAISRDGRFVTFESQASNLRWNDTNGFSDVYLWDRLGVIDIKRVSVRSGGAQGNGASRDPDISADGKFIVFDSFARNLVNNDKNGRRDCFLHNRLTGKTVIVSLNSQERRGNGACSDASVSSNGRWVAFASRATNMTQGDRSTAPDIFVRDRKLGKTVQVSLSSRGQQASGWSGDPSISNNGRYIAFESTAGNLVRKDPNKRLGRLPA